MSEYQAKKYAELIYDIGLKKYNGNKDNATEYAMQETINAYKNGKLKQKEMIKIMEWIVYTIEK